MNLGINASRARSGGAKAHLIGILTEGNPVEHGFAEVHVWSYRELLNALPDSAWLFKHCPRETEQAMLRQLWWERFTLPKALRESGCDVLLNVDAGSVCRFRPAVTMSRDMLAFEPGEIERLGYSKARLRQILLRHIQSKSLTVSDGAIFLTHYAARVIQQSSGQVGRLAFIPHGIGEIFKNASPQLSWPKGKERPIRCLYVSPVWEFKHQWVVVRAIEILRKRGHAITLVLIGGGRKAALQLLERQLRQSDPLGVFVQQTGFVPHQELPGYLVNADIFVFASSCENMPVSLLEAMATGLPIACSNRGPMPEVLEDGGVYFDPVDSASIATAIEQIITDPALRTRIAQRAKELSNKYSWKQCAEETFSFIAEILKTKSLELTFTSFEKLFFDF